MPVKTILFDINETVLDLQAMSPLFEAMFEGKATLDQWFAALLHASTVSTITKVQTNFKTLAEISLNKLATKHSVDKEKQRCSEIITTFKALPPHPDIIPALKQLRENQFELIAFSNSSNQLLKEQITNAGLMAYFDDTISVENSGNFKPHATAYAYASKTLKKPLDNMCLIAAHDWDTHGALSAGMHAAYLNRYKDLYNPLYKQPDYTGISMIDIAEKIIAAKS